MIERELSTAFYQTANAIPYATAVTPNLALGNIFTTTMTGDMTLNNVSPVGNSSYFYYITMDGTGGYTFALASNWNLISGAFDPTPNAVNILNFLTFVGQSGIQLFINQRP